MEKSSVKKILQQLYNFVQMYALEQMTLPLILAQVKLTSLSRDLTKTKGRVLKVFLK